MSELTPEEIAADRHYYEGTGPGTEHDEMRRERAGTLEAPGVEHWRRRAEAAEAEVSVIYKTAVMTMERADMMPGVSMRELFDHYLQERRDS